MQEAWFYQAAFALASGNNFYYSNQGSVVLNSEPCSAKLFLFLPTVHPMLIVTQQYCSFHFTSLIYSWSVPSIYKSFVPLSKRLWYIYKTYRNQGVKGSLKIPWSFCPSKAKLQIRFPKFPSSQGLRTSLVVREIPTLLCAPSSNV